MEAGRLPQPIHLSCTVSPQGDAICPPDSTHARQPPQPGGAAGRAGHMSYTPSSGRPDHVTRVVTPGRDGKATAQTTVPTRPNSMHVMKSAAAEESDRKEAEAAPIFI